MAVAAPAPAAACFRNLYVEKKKKWDENKQCGGKVFCIQNTYAEHLMRRNICKATHCKTYQFRFDQKGGGISQIGYGFFFVSTNCCHRRRLANCNQFYFVIVFEKYSDFFYATTMVRSNFPLCSGLSTIAALSDNDVTQKKR